MIFGYSYIKKTGKVQPGYLSFFTRWSRLSVRCVPYMVKKLPERRLLLMREDETPKTATAVENPQGTDRPWTDLAAEEDDSIGEAVRCSLDEIRYA